MRTTRAWMLATTLGLMACTTTSNESGGKSGAAAATTSAGSPAGSGRGGGAGSNAGSGSGSSAAAANGATTNKGGGLSLDTIGKNAEKEAKKLEKQGAPYASSCKAEIEKYCKVDKKELKALVECLKKNEKVLGPACRTAVENLAKDKNKK